jgi:hypothetical protein
MMRSCGRKRRRLANPQQTFTHAFLTSAYALKNETERAAELSEARRLCSDNRYSSIARLKAAVTFGEIRALHEATFIAGLRKAGMPEE